MDNENSILIIGGNSSIMPALVSRLSKNGMTVDETIRSIKPEKKSIHIRTSFQLDLADGNSCDQFINDTKSRIYKHIIFLAGRTSSIEFQKMSYSEIEYIYRSNVIGISYILSKLAERIQREGKIIILGSVAADGGSYDVAYGASKAALRATVQSFSKKLTDRSIHIIEPTTIENSGMFNEMSQETKNKHYEKNGGILVSVDMVVKKITDILSKKQFNEVVIQIRPSGSK